MKSPVPAISPAALLTLLQHWPAEETIHRRILILADVQPGQDVLWVGSGLGQSVLWWAARLNTRVEGIAPDPVLVERADAAARARGLEALVTFQVADPGDLPHEPAVFDLTLVNLMHLPGADAARVFREAGRVARPLTPVVAVAPAWLGAPAEEDRRAIAGIGIVPRRVVEWKEALRAGGVVELEVEEAARDGEWVLQNRLGLASLAWREWGWAGVRATLQRGVAVLQRLTRQRTLGLVIIKGTRWHP